MHLACAPHGYQVFLDVLSIPNPFDSPTPIDKFPRTLGGKLQALVVVFACHSEQSLFPVDASSASRNKVEKREGDKRSLKHLGTIQ